MRIETFRKKQAEAATRAAERAITRAKQREAALANRRLGPQPVYACCFDEAHLPEGHHGLDCGRQRV